MTKFCVAHSENTIDSRVSIEIIVNSIPSNSANLATFCQIYPALATQHSLLFVKYLNGIVVKGAGHVQRTGLRSEVGIRGKYININVHFLF